MDEGAQSGQGWEAKPPNLEPAGYSQRVPSCLDKPAQAWGGGVVTGTQAGVWFSSPAPTYGPLPLPYLPRGRTAGLSTAAPVSVRMPPEIYD